MGRFDGTFDGKVALVTGAGTGIGRASARLFAASGARVVVADVAEDHGAETVALIEKDGGEARFVGCDVTDAGAVDAMVAATLEAFGRLDAAHNNAGMSGYNTGIVDLPDELWHQTIALNLTGVFHCMRAELRVMRDQGSGAVVNTSSGAGLIGFADLPAYVASKHGVVGLTKSAALQFAREGIRVNCVCPGTTRTPMIEGYIGDDPDMAKMMDSTCPNGRMARPEEIAEAVVWLASDQASYVNGVALPVDAGAVAQ